MYDRSEGIAELATALAAAQGEISAAAESGNNPHLKSKYSTLGDVWEACRKPLSKNGLSIVQTPSVSDGVLTVTTTLLHSSGQYIEASLSANLGDARAMSVVQGMGSVITYLRRYTLASLVGVYTGDDDDGEAAQRAAQPTKAAPRAAQLPAPATTANAPEQTDSAQPAASERRADWTRAFLDHIATTFELRGGVNHARNALRKAGLEPARDRHEAAQQIEALRAFRAANPPDGDAEAAEVNAANETLFG